MVTIRIFYKGGDLIVDQPSVVVSPGEAVQFAPEGALAAVFGLAPVFGKNYLKVGNSPQTYTVIADASEGLYEYQVSDLVKLVSLTLRVPPHMRVKKRDQEMEEAFIEPSRETLRFLREHPQVDDVVIVREDDGRLTVSKLALPAIPGAMYVFQHGDLDLTVRMPDGLVAGDPVALPDAVAYTVDPDAEPGDYVCTLRVAGYDGDAVLPDVTFTVASRPADADPCGKSDRKDGS